MHNNAHCEPVPNRSYSELGRGSSSAAARAASSRMNAAPQPTARWPAIDPNAAPARNGSRDSYSPTTRATYRMLRPQPRLAMSASMRWVVMPAPQRPRAAVWRVPVGVSVCHLDSCTSCQALRPLEPNDSRLGGSSSSGGAARSCVSYGSSAATRARPAGIGGRTVRARDSCHANGGLAGSAGQSGASGG